MDYDVIIIGSGPAGYVAAIRAGQVGLKTAVIEKEKLGGMCLNWGCIPTKALLESAKWYRQLQRAGEWGIDGIDADRLRFNWPAARRRSQAIVDKLTKGIEFLLKKNTVTFISGEAAIATPTTVRVGNRRLEAGHLLIASGSLPEMVTYPVPPDKVSQMRELLEREEIPPQLLVAGQGANAVELAQSAGPDGEDSHLAA